MLSQGLRLVDEDEGSGVVDPHELDVRKVVDESFGVRGGMSLSCPIQMMRTGPAKVRCSSAQSEQLLGFGALRR